MDKREELPPEKRDVEVAFVDFGKTTHVKLSETRKLKQEFLHLPFQVSTAENYLFHLPHLVRLYTCLYVGGQLCIIISFLLRLRHS